MSRTAQVGAGSYTVAFSVSNGHAAPVTKTLQIAVTREGAVVAPSASNPTAVMVKTAGGTAGPVTLQATFTEATDDTTNGNISNAVPVTYTLTPLGAGSISTCTATTSGGGIGGTLITTCTFASLAVNVYDVRIAIGGNYYQGAAENVLAVYDPSLGFATGGGKFLHNIVKNNATGSLSVTGNTAYILGKATLNGVGNYSFRATVIDNGEPGTSDQFGLRVKDPTGTVIPDLTFPPITLSDGNIVVPHK